MSFSDMAAAFAEQPSNFNLLRIVATDGNGLSRDDRAILRAAADDLEASQRAHSVTYGQLVEAERRASALNDRVTELNAELLKLRAQQIPFVARTF